MGFGSSSSVSSPSTSSSFASSSACSSRYAWSLLIRSCFIPLVSKPRARHSCFSSASFSLWRSSLSRHLADLEVLLNGQFTLRISALHYGSTSCSLIIGFLLSSLGNPAARAIRRVSLMHLPFCFSSFQLAHNSVCK